MKIVDFSAQYIEKSQALALQNYNEEREIVKCLPKLEEVADVSHFSENGLGVCAVEGEEVLGFLGCYMPWDNQFGTAAKGTFSPLQSHGAVKENREKIYQFLYQAAAEKWVENGIFYHAIVFYSHDREGLSAMFGYNFGIRCMDAMRKMENFQTDKSPEGITFREILKNEVSLVRDMRAQLNAHLGKSPCFMYTSQADYESWLKRAESRNSRIFGAFENGESCGFIEVTDEGENFATEVSDIRNICGAFCKPELRGKFIMQNLLNFVISTYKAEGYKYLGVDFESMNPTAYHFWLKHFDGYTKSVTRRIDEHF